MTTVAHILQELPKATEQPALEGAGSNQFPVVVIANGNAPAVQVSVHVVCVDMQTTGIILTPLHWETPPDPDHRKLWAPPDDLGWRIMDVMEEAQVGRVLFWNRSRYAEPERPASPLLE